MGDTEFSGGDFRDGFGADDLADFGGGDGFGFDDFPQDGFSQGLVGASDLTTGMPGQQGDNYSNVNVPQNDSPTDALLRFYGDEAKNGLTAFGKLFVDSMSTLGKLPIGSLGGLWAGWVLLGVILLPISSIGFLVAQHFVNAAGGVAVGGVATARTLFSAGFSLGGLSLISGGIFGFIMTSKLKRGDKTLSGVELEVTGSDAEEDNSDGFGAAEECFEDVGYSEDDEIYDAGVGMDSNPYDDILATPEEEPEPELVEDTRKVTVQNQPPEVINRTLDNLSEMMNNGNLHDTIFKIALDILPCYYPNFTDVKIIEQGSDQWATLEHFILNSIKIVTGTEDDGDISTRIKEIKRTSVSYYIVASRYSKMKSTAQLEMFDKELKGFLDDTAEAGEAAVAIGDKAEVSCQTVAKGNDYIISIIMPSKKIVSLGDIYHTQAFQDYVKSGKRLPICLGLNGAGQMMNYDAKPDNGVMLCGQTRSGKSWFTTYYLFNDMILQTPMQHQFIIIDPKTTGLLEALSFMPHVMGLHWIKDDDPQSPRNLLKILEEIIVGEGERRKALFKEKGYENYWDYIDGEGDESLPLITLVIDEYLSVNNMFKETKAKLGEDLRPLFLNYINSLVSKLPAYGLRLLIIPHRVPGCVEPVTRDLMKFKATFRSSEDLSTSNLGLNKVGIPLPNAGDMAWTSEMQTKPLYTHTLCVGNKDNIAKNTFVLMAKAYYKLGVPMPDMSYMKVCFTRNDPYIAERIKTWNFNKKD